MPTIRLSADKLPDALRQHMRRDLAAFVRLTGKAAERGVENARAIADQEDILDLGTYRDSFSVRVNPRSASIVNTAEHAATIEYGRRPGATPPPLEPLRGWLIRKFGYEEGTWELERAARGLRDAITRRGLPPRRVMARAFRHARSQLVGLVKTYLRYRGGQG